MRLATTVSLFALLAAASSPAQVIPYGSPSPAPYAARLDSGGQVPYIGNALFRLQLANAANNFGAILGVSAAPATIPLGR